MNHVDIVNRVRNGAPLDTSSAPAILQRLLEVIAALPPAERGGLLRKDAGENILFYAPANCNVSISRVCYPDGQLVKVFTDSGPGGANAAAWNDDGTVEPSRYVPVTAGLPANPPPLNPPQTPASSSMPDYSGQLDDLKNRISTLTDRMDELIALEKNRPAAVAYEGSFTIAGKKVKLHLDPK